MRRWTRIRIRDGAFFQSEMSSHFRVHGVHLAKMKLLVLSSFMNIIFMAKRARCSVVVLKIFLETRPGSNRPAAGIVGADSLGYLAFELADFVDGRRL